MLHQWFRLKPILLLSRPIRRLAWHGGHVVDKHGGGLVGDEQPGTLARVGLLLNESFDFLLHLGISTSHRSFPAVCLGLRHFA